MTTLDAKRAAVVKAAKDAGLANESESVGYNGQRWIHLRRPGCGDDFVCLPKDHPGPVTMQLTVSMTQALHMLTPVTDFSDHRNMTRWEQGREPGTVITPSPFPGSIWSLETVEAYGGYPIAESVLPHFLPLILAAPDLLKWARAFLAYTDHVGECEGCIEGSHCETGGNLWNEAERLLTMAAGRVPKTVFPEHVKSQEEEGDSA